MITKKNLWSNDQGFIWLLSAVIIILVLLQFRQFVLGELLLIRIGFFIFMIVAIASSLLSDTGKKLGYAVSTLLLLFGFILTQSKSSGVIIVYSGVLTAFMIFTLILLVKQIFGKGIMTWQKIGGGIAAYIIIGLLWTALYLTVFELDPGSFQFSGGVIQKENAVRQLSYFSFITITTTGFGDITAVGPFARVLVIFESLLGQLFPAIFIAKLVGLQIEDSRKTSD